MDSSGGTGSDSGPDSSASVEDGQTLAAARAARGIENRPGDILIDVFMILQLVQRLDDHCVTCPNSVNSHSGSSEIS